MQRRNAGSAGKPEGILSGCWILQILSSSHLANIFCLNKPSCTLQKDLSVRKKELEKHFEYNVKDWQCSVCNKKIYYSFNKEIYSP